MQYLILRTITGLLLISGCIAGYYASPMITSLLLALTLLYVLPILVTIYIARTLTMVNSDGIIVRALFGQRALPWAEVRGLSISGRSVYAVQADGAVRLPCVRIHDLAAISIASGGRLPDIPEATPKYAPGGRRRR